MSFLTQLRAKFSGAHAARSHAAAEQILAALKRGCVLELPQTFSKEDETGQAIALLMELHPEVNLSLMLQSRSLVLSIDKQGKVSPGAWKTLEQYGYFPDTKLTPETMLAVHEKFSRAAGVEVSDASGANEAADKARHAVAVGGVGGVGGGSAESAGAAGAGETVPAAAPGGAPGGESATPEEVAIGSGP